MAEAVTLEDSTGQWKTSRMGQGLSRYLPSERISIKWLRALDFPQAWLTRIPRARMRCSSVVELAEVVYPLPITRERKGSFGSFFC